MLLSLNYFYGKSIGFFKALKILESLKLTEWFKNYIKLKICDKGLKIW